MITYDPSWDDRRTTAASRRRALTQGLRLAAVIGCAPVLVGMAALSGGCAKAPKPASSSSVSGSISGAADLNPSVSQRPSPLLLRVYELRSATAFNQADFMSLYQADQAALSTDLVAREEVLLQPGETRPFSKQLGPETRFIAVVAAYRDLERATWRAIAPVQPGRAQKLSISAGALAVSITVQP